MKEGVLPYCIIKQQYKGNKRLPKAITWCGVVGANNVYLNAHYAAISERCDICEDCKEKLIEAISRR